jgi:predicted O-methyltransferase YrrM
MIGLLRRLRRRLKARSESGFDPHAPFGTTIRAPQATYLALHEEACRRSYPEVDRFLLEYRRQIDIDWMNRLALHTQVVIKQSQLNFQHGRILYAVFDALVDRSPEVAHFTVFETGTSRGFSILCLSRVLTDRGREGKLVTLDRIEHNRRHLWNCVDDHDGPRTRHELLEPWRVERDRVVFVSGDSARMLDAIGVGRIHFAFLDGSHTEVDVMREYAYVATRQESGDVIVIDDVTPGLFDGIVAAVQKIEEEGLYRIQRLQAEERRAYANATRVQAGSVPRAIMRDAF